MDVRSNYTTIRPNPENNQSTYFFQRVLLPCCLLRLHCLSLCFHCLRHEVRNSWWYRWWRLVEPRRDAQLALIYLLDALQPLPLSNFLQILFRSVKQRNANVCLLQRANVVRPIARHERNVPKRLQSREDVLLLRRRHTRIYPCVLHKIVPRRPILKVPHRNARHADVVLVEEGLIEGCSHVDRDHFAFIHRAPDEVCGKSAHIEISKERYAPASCLGFSARSRISASRSTISTSRAT